MARVMVLISMVLLLMAPLVAPVAASVMPEVWADDVKVAGDNSNFQVRIYVRSNQNATYRVHLQESKDFLFINTDGNKEAFVAKGGNMSFNFTLRTESDITKGTYEVKYDLYMNEVLTNTSLFKVTVDIRNQPTKPVTICSSSYLGILAIGIPLALLFIRKRRPSSAEVG